MVTPHVIFTILCFTILVYDEFVNGSHLPTYEYIGETWKVPPTHVKVPFKTGDDYDVVWSEMLRVDVIYVKNPAEPYFSRANRLTKDQWRDVESKVSEVVAELKQLILGVRLLNDPILVPRRCLNQNKSRTWRSTNCNDAGFTCERSAICYDLDIPDKYAGDCYVNNAQQYDKGQGSNSDLLLFISVSDCEDELTNAVSCQRETDFRRSVAARIAVCYRSVENRQPSLKDILMHELLHILLMPISGRWYRNSENNYLNYSHPFLIETRKWLSAAGTFERTFVIGQTPTVRKVVREHFNCENLPGAEFYFDKADNFDPHQYAHFDGRLFPDALLAPVYNPGNKLTKLDVALLIDSGWYKVNRSMGRQMTITRGKGCAFAELSCYEFMKKAGNKPADLYPYCRKSDVSNWGCSADAGQVGYCDGKHQDTANIEPEFTLDDNFYGSLFSSFCPMVLPKNSHVAFDSSPLCQEAEHVDFEPFGATGGVNSICMAFSKFNSKQTKPQCPKGHYARLQGVCVLISCISNGIFIFKFGGHNFNCSRGKKISSVFIRTKLHDCEVSFQATCPDFDVCLLMTNSLSINRGSKYFNSFIVEFDIYFGVSGNVMFAFIFSFNVFRPF